MAQNSKKMTEREEGLPPEGVHKELLEAILSLTDEEVQLVTHLLASSQTLPLRGQLVRYPRPNP